MEAIAAPRTKRMRQVRRRLKGLKRDQEWVLARLQRETDPQTLLQLREILQHVGKTGLPVLTGIQYQESRLPRDGPADCPHCDWIHGTFVPIRYQRIFEDGLRATGASPEAVYELPEYKPPITGSGRGFIATGRSKHSEHLDSYEEWRRRQRKQ